VSEVAWKSLELLSWVVRKGFRAMDSAEQSCRKAKRLGRLGVTVAANKFHSACEPLVPLVASLSVSHVRKCLPVEPFLQDVVGGVNVSPHLINPPISKQSPLEHEFHVLGRSVRFNSAIDWQADFNGGSWPRLRAADYSKLFRGDFSLPEYRKHGDVKRVWDFNKHLHFVDLAARFRLTRDAAYDREVTAQFLDWVEKNPYPHGMGWFAPLIVSQRAISWIIAFNLGCLSSVERDLAKALHVHGQDLSRRLEISGDGWSSNHLIGNLAALYLIGASLHVDRWRRRALRLLEVECGKQFRGEAHYEQSSNYHRYVLEFLTLVWLVHSDHPKPRWLTETLVRMTHFLKAISLPDGSLPLLSDQDGARVWVRNIYSPSELYRLYGGSQYRSFGSQGFVEAGYYVMRHRNSVLLFDCGPIGMKGQRLTTHGHSDLLSFVLAVRGKPFVVDIGSYTYTEDKALHDYFRGTAGHNTVTVDGQDQCGLGGTWTLKKHPRCWVKDWRTSATEDAVCGAHDGYWPLVHERRIVFKKHANPTIQVTDTIEGNESHKIVSRLHLHPDVRVEDLDSHSAKLLNGDVSLNLAANGQRPFLTMKTGLYSPDYGQIQETRVLDMTVTGRCPITLSTSFSPGS